MSEPSWLRIARADLGVKEVKGAVHAPAIIRAWRTVKAPFTDDETPWCGGILGAWMTQAGYGAPAACWRARNWLNWGREMPWPVLGCVVVFSRDGGGHVALVVGRTPDGKLACLGGNQGDAVSIAAFPEARVLGYRMPIGYQGGDMLPTVNADGSRSEA